LTLLEDFPAELTLAAVTYQWWHQGLGVAGRYHEP
jgi:hypothetical protein